MGSFVAAAIIAATIAVESHKPAAAPKREAAPSVRIAVLPLSFAGEEDAGAVNRLAERVAEGLARGGVELVDKSQVDKALGGKACKDQGCAVALARDTKSRFVVRTTVGHRDRVYELRVELLDGNTGDVVATATDRCEICGLEEVGDAMADQAAMVRGKVDALGRPPTMLRVDSVPPGARVLLDGEPVGTTPLEREVRPGEHVVRLEHRGYFSNEREVVAVEGMEQKVKLDLVAVPVDDEADRKKARRLVVAGGASLGIGVALIAAGIPLIVLDSRQYKSRCSGDDMDVNGTCRFSYDTLTGGAVLVASGAAAAITGAVLVGVGKKRGKSDLRASVLPGGLALRGRF